MPPDVASRQQQDSTSILGHSQWMLVLGFLLALRITNALSIKTFFQPDEYFQSLEPAWQIAFGAESGAWITWEWREGLRTALHPWIFAVVYKITDVISTLEGATRTARAQDMLIAPKIVQGMFAAAMDFYTWKLGRKIYGADSDAAMATLALTALSPWQWYTSTRTFANSFETTLTIMALSWWPWTWFIEAPASDGMQMNVLDDGPSLELRDFLQDTGADATSRLSSSSSSQGAASSLLSPSSHGSRLNAALAAAAIACMLRPTNIIIWMTISCATMLHYINISRSAKLVQSALIVGLLVLAVTLLVDQSFYRTLTVPPVRFLYLNIMQDLAVFYGRNRVDYYFTEGLPLLLITALPFAATGLWSALIPGPDRPQFAGYVQRQTLHILALVVVTTVLAFSMIAHKEMRFIYPLLPVLHVLAAKPLAHFFRPFPLPRSYFRFGLLVIGLAANIYIAAYVSTIHQRGVIDVMHYLRHEAESESGVRNTTVGFLMPCHSTPWRSHFVHPEIDAWALTCEPPIDVAREDRANYLDEADVFYLDPMSWMDNNMADRKTVLQSTEAMTSDKADESRRPWPEYLVFFEHLEPVMNAMLENTRYEECWRGFNTHWHDDGRRKGDVVVRCLRE